MDNKTKQGKFLPLLHNDAGDIRGALFSDEGVSLTQLNRVVEGQPLMGGRYVALQPGEDPPVLNAEIIALPTPTGPPKVNTDAYRTGWDRIFGAAEMAEA